jgi:DNA-binding FadR family transcriptional regulator
VAWLDGDLHLRVVEISQNRWLVSIGTALYHHVHRVLRAGPEPREPHPWREHIPLVDAIAAGDRETATEVARLHAEAATREVLRPGSEDQRPEA